MKKDKSVIEYIPPQYDYKRHKPGGYSVLCGVSLYLSFWVIGIAAVIPCAILGIIECKIEKKHGTAFAVIAIILNIVLLALWILFFYAMAVGFGGHYIYH